MILMLVGFIGLAFSFLALGSLDWFGGGARSSTTYARDTYVERDPVTPAHEHQRVSTTDVVVEDDRTGTHTERVRRVER